ncbi:type I-E CRISPR-associated protein Cas5/CasD [Streptomyces sp. ST2-7A]|uniref:type I-E CRISPR-associated protein Cas5/CasD n=1 Tax=Streptomyces sp. ST2-7A TaxID=2907214 RepID=UPI001F283453|nr:type I-E CRISPR-associated protein Cas5/CasD [Streptomyces sp. ST2-7A]MCE7081673.1 type I-E CRISPR-associated protein Cas5/CasD [Streptomyces sp. ST2-7A]
MSHTAHPLRTEGPTPEPGLLLSLNGPLQSWGERSHFNERDTSSFPTRSGVLGLLAAALGRRRGEPIEDLQRLSLTVRADRPGVLMRDLHTVGGGLPAKETVTTAEGKKRSGDTATLLSHRWYLADAAFTVALTSPDGRDRNTLDLCARALRSPHWPPYLGRRSCPPEGPLLITTSSDALHELLHLPLRARRPHGENAAVEFVGDRPLDRLPTPTRDSSRPTSQINDDRSSSRRTFRARPLYRCSIPLPARQFAGHGTHYLNHLTHYLASTHTERSTP